MPEFRGLRRPFGRVKIAVRGWIDREDLPMDKQARQLRDELLALKSKADQLAETQRATGNKIQAAIESRQQRPQQRPAEAQDEAASE